MLSTALLKEWEQSHRCWVIFNDKNGEVGPILFIATPVHKLNSRPHLNLVSDSQTFFPSHCHSSSTCSSPDTSAVLSALSLGSWILFSEWRGLSGFSICMKTLAWSSYCVLLWWQHLVKLSSLQLCIWLRDKVLTPLVGILPSPRSPLWCPSCGLGQGENLPPLSCGSAPLPCYIFAHILIDYSNTGKAYSA